MDVSKRVQKLYDALKVSKIPFCTQKAELFTEAFQKYDYEPPVKRMALAQAHILDNIDIWMQEGELIAGAPCSKPMGVEADFWTRGVWEKEGIESIRGTSEWSIDDETADRMYVLSDYWRVHTPELERFKYYDDEMWKWRFSGFLLPACQTVNQAAGSGYAVNGMEILVEGDIYNLKYDYILGKGLNAMIADFKAELAKITTLSIKGDEEINRRETLEAMIIIDEAVIRWVGRYADLAEEQAAACSDPVRKAELLSIAETCRRIPGEPAKTFQDAITFQWFVFLMTACMTTAPVCRADQYLYPYYKADLEAGRIDVEKALEYLECYRIKMMQMKNTAGGSARLKWQGQARWNGITIGGVDADGNDATNDLTYLFIEAAKRLRTPLPSLTLRVHERTPLELMRAAMDLIKTGIGFPALVSDKNYIQTLMDKGVPIEVARGYHILGCIDTGGPEMGGHAFSLLVQTVPLDSFLHNGHSVFRGMDIGPQTGDVRKMKTWEEFYEKLMEHNRWFFQYFAQDYLIRHLLTRRSMPDPFTASIYSDAAKVAKTWRYRDLPYKVGPVISIGVGIINFGQSLYAIKKLVYDEKKLTMDELIAALDANWVGERNQEIRRMCMALPQYGNNIPDVDDFIAAVFSRVADEGTSIMSYRGVPFNVAAISITSHDPGGRITGATPDGRYAGDILADASLSPIQGRDVSGPLATMISAMKMPHRKLLSVLMNMKLSPGLMKTQSDIDKLISVCMAFLNNDGKQIQFNVVDNAELQAAKTEPEKHQDLIVRVAGYSTYFVRLGSKVQDEIIARTCVDELK